MKKIFSCLIFLLLSIISNAQLLQGRLIDSLTKTPLPYSNVLIKNIKDSTISCVLTNEKGEFKINIKSIGNFKLVAGSMGYKEKIVLMNNIKNNEVYKIGDINLTQKTYQLNEANITYNKNYIEQKFDRKVFNITDNKTAAARTIFDILRTLPGVVVDENGGVKYKGTEATIYIDDQPSEYLYPKIEMIPVENISKIELIDAAMQTGGSGRGGIINIKHRTVTNDGFSGLAKTNLGTIEFKNIDESDNFLNLNYKKKKITFFNNCFYQNDLQSFIKKTENQVSSFLIPSYQNIYNNTKFNQQIYGDFIGAFFTPSLKTKMYLGVGFFNNNYKYPWYETFSEMNTVNNETINDYNSSGNADNTQINKGINFALKHVIDTNDTYIRILASYKINNNDNNTNTIFDYNIINSAPVDSIYNYSDRKDEISKRFSCTIFYNRTISKNTRWNLNYNNTIIFNGFSKNNHYLFNDLYLPQCREDNSNTQQHNLSWHIGTQLKKWKIDGGINFSDSYIKGNYIRYREDNSDTILYINKNYFRALPSATIAFDINDTEEVKLTCSQTSKFPIFSNLSDYIDKYNPYYWSSGNSDLKPVDIYSIYLGYSYNKDKWNATVEGFFDYTNNEVTSIHYPLSSLLILSKPENIAKVSSNGVDFSTWFMVTSKLNFSLSSSLFYTNYNTTALKNTASFFNLPVSDLIKTQFGYYIKCNMEYKIKKYYVMFYANYNSKELTYDGYNKAWINSSFSISRKILKDKLSVSIDVDNIFDDMVDHGSYSDNFGIINNIRTYDSKYKRLYSITIQYNFRKGDRGTKDYKISG